MKNINNAIFYAIFIIATSSSNSNYSMWEPAGTYFGYKFGVGALETMGAGIQTTAAAAHGAAVYVAPAVPYVAGAAVVGYGAYKVHQRYNPSEETIAQAEQYKAQAEQHKAQGEQSRFYAEQQRILTAQAVIVKEKLQKEYNFTRCLSKNAMSERNSFGIPAPCQQEAHDYAVVGGDEDITNKVILSHKYTPEKQFIIEPLPQTSGWWWSSSK